MLHLQKRTLVILLLAVTFLAADAVSANADERRNIDECTVIDRPGSYRLENVIVARERDLTEVGTFRVCILIEADFVTLDLAGNTIIGPRAGVGTGIGAFGDRRSIKVHNGAVTNFLNGVLLEGNSHTVEHIRATEYTSKGIAVGFIPVGLSTGSGHRVVGNIANAGITSDSFGISVECPSVVLDNMAKGNVQGDMHILGVCTRLANFPPP